MARSKTRVCETCGGQKVIPAAGGRYTDTVTEVCPDCDGAGVKAADEGEAAAQAVEAEANGKKEAGSE